MNLTELQARLRALPELPVRIRRPDGTLVPLHYHLTEVGHVVKRFVDCGGKFRATESCVLQTHYGSTRDDGHRLTAGKFAAILDLAKPILPAHELAVEVEYDVGVISQSPLQAVVVADGAFELELEAKHTDCLAKAKCGTDEAGSDAGPTEEAAAKGGCCGRPAGAVACC